MKREKRYYIAYGSNLDIKRMRYRCPEATIFGTGEIKDYELLFKGSQTGSYLTIEPKVGASVPVAIWEVTPWDEQALDRYEGFPTFYFKKEFKIHCDLWNTGRRRNITAFAYLMHPYRKLGMPSQDYMWVCQNGYADFDFDPSILWKALDNTRKRMREDAVK